MQLLSLSLPSNDQEDMSNAPKPTNMIRNPVFSTCNVTKKSEEIECKTLWCTILAIKGLLEQKQICCHNPTADTWNLES